MDNIFGQSLKDYKIVGINIMLAFLLASFTAILVFLLPSLPLFYVALLYFCVGVTRFALYSMRTKTAHYESIFISPKRFLTIFCAKTLSIIISCLWALLLIVPGIISLLNFSFVSHILADGETNSFDALQKSKQLVFGKRTEIFLIYLFATFLILLIACVSCGLALFVNLLVPIQLWLKLCIAIVLALIPIYVFVLPYVQICINNVYLSIVNKQQVEKKRKTIGNKSK